MTLLNLECSHKGIWLKDNQLNKNHRICMEIPGSPVGFNTKEYQVLL